MKHQLHLTFQQPVELTQLRIGQLPAVTTEGVFTDLYRYACLVRRRRLAITPVPTTAQVVKELAVQRTVLVQGYNLRPTTVGAVVVHQQPPLHITLAGHPYHPAILVVHIQAKIVKNDKI